MMNIILKLIVLIGGFFIFFISCDEEEIGGNSNVDPQKMVSFAQDTVYLPEEDSLSTVAIVVPKYVNGAVYLTLGCTDGTAKRDTHFYIDVLEAKIPIGGMTVDFPIEVYNDTSMAGDRYFTLELLEVTGVAYAGVERQKCVVIIKNDDFPVEATARFIEPKVMVFENAGKVNIPFEIVGADLKGDAFITFDYDKSIGNADSTDFRFMNGGKVLLKKGDTTGFVTLDIYDNSIENDTIRASIYMGAAEGVFVDKEVGSTCELTIVDDDITRTVGFRVVVDSALENSGKMSVDIVIAGKPKFDESIITGELYFLGPDSLADTRGLKILGDPKFKVRGDTTISYDIEITDNFDFGGWEDTLALRNIKVAVPDVAKRNFIVKVLDDERKVSFKEAEYSVDETAHGSGDFLRIPIALEGGVALEDTRITLVVDKGNTLEGQYEVDSYDLTIPKGASSVLAEVTVNKNPSLLDTYFVLGLETDPEQKSITLKDSVCKVNIVNKQTSVQFVTSPQMLLHKNTSDTLRIKGSNLEDGKSYRVELELTDGDGVTTSGFNSLLSLTQENPEQYIVLRATTTGGIGASEVSIKSVTIEGNEVEAINPIFDRTLIHVLSTDKGVLTDEGVLTAVDRKSWTVNSVISQQNDGSEGENNGGAINAIDSVDDKFWHTQWTGSGTPAATPEAPHWVVYDMQKNVFPIEVELRRRHNNETQLKEAKIFMGNSGTGPWVEISHLKKDVAADMTVKGVTKSIMGRYVRIESYHVPHTTIAEFRIFGFNE